MRARSDAGLHMMRFESGDEICEALAHYCHDNGISTASVQGIGAVCEATLGYYSPATNQYIKRDFAGDMEVVSLAGNVSMLNGVPFAHLHAVLAGRIDGAPESDFMSYGGHLFRGIVSPTLEVFITKFNHTVARKPEQGSGLNLLDL